MSKVKMSKVKMSKIKMSKIKIKFFYYISNIIKQ